MSNAGCQPNYITALRNQPKTADVAPSDAWVCPYCHNAGSIFQSLEQLLLHARYAHSSILPPSGGDASEFRARVKLDALATRKALADGSSEVTAGNTSTPDLTTLSLLEPAIGRHADTEFAIQAVGPMDIYGLTHTVVLECAGSADTGSMTPGPPSEERSIKDAPSHQTSHHSPHPKPDHRVAPPPVFNPKPQPVTPLPPVQSRQSGLGDLQKYDPRYPELLLQPESRAISEEQLASEVKSIYTELTTVETKCIHVGWAEAAQMQDPNATPKLGSEYWQALIALHRTLLHEHHDFFLASQHPSASPALRRLAAKYSMPALGHLYHHLAILARPNALQQLYYYARSLTCIKPFLSARESILTLLDPILGRSTGGYTQALPINTFFIQAHGVLFEKLTSEQFKDARINFQSQLDNHIGHVTTKWKKQGVYIAVTNITSLFDYGADDSILCIILHLHYQQLSRTSASRQASTHSDNNSSPIDQESASPSITEADIPAQLEVLARNFTFSRAYLLAMSTLSLVLRHIGDKNVLPYLHVLLSFFASFASIKYIAHLIDHAPWSEIIPFLNTLLKTDRPEHISDIFPTNSDEHTQPLPEDYLIRSQIWSQSYFPRNWFARELGEEERYLEPASTIKLRTERIVRLAFHLATYERWITYDSQFYTFSVVNSSDLVLGD
ncbi:hypothetical protein P154DRAFT_614286 [Amniculicola lignicola CBS 123094]|uniref:DNA/RNA-binding domain-containing protein n=1 Tax=Amniculicola lignicola CBS 123094 TaxID=1392246 RepID=A0A6A5X4T1_9PLEO|nr:hypothetical protein P154DRAFT_614286 [Amniculicola lignicola CBS 123094]